MTMLSAESFWTSSLRAAPEGERITRIMAAAITAVDPGALLGRVVRRDGDMLTISDRPYNLQLFQRVVLLGIGKASVTMSSSLAGILGARLDTGLVITKHFSANPHFSFTILEGDHPVPDRHSLEAGQKTMELVSSLGRDDLLICLISGGGSALVTAPVEGISLADIQMLTSALLACGASIYEINTVRRRFDLVKAGGITKMSNGATIVSLILSDVIGNPLEVIASGPTAPDPATRADAQSIMAYYQLEKRIPISILHYLKNSPETPKPGDSIFDRVQNVIVGSNLLAAQSALMQAKLENFHPYLLRTDLQGDARQAAFELATFLRQARLTGNPVPCPAVIVAGGETTVTLKGNGKGGRNTELALAAVSELADFPGVMLAALATDGEDGPTDAAGAIVTSDTFRRAAGLGLHPGDFLERNDSYTFFSALDDLFKPGTTGTNVNDLVFLVTF
jgi:hydroxypyruvate reductase